MQVACLPCLLASRRPAGFKSGRLRQGSPDPRFLTANTSFGCLSFLFRHSDLFPTPQEGHRHTSRTKCRACRGPSPWPEY
eukprot:XP_001695279.1 predicted protein [Chlamydomonas reinhardtii]